MAHKREDRWDYCRGCHQYRRPEDWMGVESGHDPLDVTVLCRACQVNGPPPVDAAIAIDPKWRRLAKKVFEENKSLSAAAKELKLDPATVRMKLSRDSEVRRMFQLMLETEGLDFQALTTKARQLFDSQKAQWNKAKEDWDLFPDNAAQLGAWRHLTRLHELEPLRDKAGSGPAVQVIINSNLGGAGEVAAPPDPAEFVIETQPMSSEPAE